MSEVLERATVVGRPPARPVSGGDTFVHRSMKLLTSGPANSGLDKTDDAAVRATCRYVHTSLGASLTRTRLDRPEGA
jgi:hypothetical protein